VRVRLTRNRSSQQDCWDLTDEQLCGEVDLREGDECSLLAELTDNEVPGAPESVDLVISGSRIPFQRSELVDGSLLAYWSWSIDFYTGELALELATASRLLWSTVLDVRPHEAKLGRDAYGELLADLHRRLENVVLGATAAQRSAVRSDAPCPPIARVAMLRAHISPVERCFARIAAAPNRRLMADRESKPIDQARRVDARSLLSIVRNPSALAALHASRDLVAVTDRPRIDHPRRLHTLNTPINRHVAALLHRSISGCRDLQAELSQMVKASESDPSSKARAIGLTEEVAVLKGRLLRLSRTEFLENVPAVSGDTAALIAVAKDPAYSRFDRLMRRVLSPRASLGGNLAEKLWLRRTYELYEYWCFVRVAEALANAHPNLAWKCNLRPEENGLLLEIPDGSFVEAREADLHVRLTFQLTFPAYRPARDTEDRPYSISGERRPDLVLSVRRGQQKAIVVLDAKYRASRTAIHAALADMHVYRDSLRAAGPGPKLMAAFILTPAHDEGGAGAYYTDAYRKKYRIGGFDLSPGNKSQAESLCEHLAWLLKEYLRQPGTGSVKAQI